MQIILTEQEFRKLKPIEEHTSYELLEAVVEKCKLNRGVKTFTFEIHTKVNSVLTERETRIYRMGGFVEKYKITIERAESELEELEEIKNG